MIYTNEKFQTGSIHKQAQHCIQASNPCERDKKKGYFQVQKTLPSLAPSGGKKMPLFMLLKDARPTRICCT